MSHLAGVDPSYGARFIPCYLPDRAVHRYSCLTHAIWGVEHLASPPATAQNEHWSVSSRQSGLALMKSAMLSVRAGAAAFGSTGSAAKAAVPPRAASRTQKANLDDRGFMKRLLLKVRSI